MEKHNLTVGSQFESAERDDKGKDYEADEDIKSVFISDEIDFYPFVAVAGVRMDSHDEWGEEYNPKLSLMYKVNENITLRTAVGRAFNAPSLSKLYGSWKMGPYTVLPGKDLEPEKSVGYEAGADVKINKNLKTSVTFFKNEVENLINSVKFKENGKRYLKWVNIDEAEIYGVEADIRLTIKDFYSGISYTYLNSEDEKTGKDLEERPDHRVNLDFSYNLRPLSAKINLNATYTGERYEDDENTVKLDSYWVFDTSVSKKITDNISVFARAENIFDEDNIEDEYDIDGRLFYAGIRGSF